jgi:hypothetical protein
MDGGFSISSHPKCRTKLGLQLQPDLLVNMLSPSLDRSKALYFYDLGLKEYI